ncbi:peptidylprolyl isomerase [Halobacteriovorax sp. GB3]|uniref:FKBP-type peptidyl-prolyl cis-trans isomerase n=1 Tax=Halobacteriovorax sp. GB3 TaxID=2719615 RepID=UPI00235F10C3|nr:peptidylprolyl isomerase [Halobacteriovorax sp. GB3]MDD0851890.1 peptidylprolyl isomerase [Halobacteriovorax sp. GB3]
MTISKNKVVTMHYHLTNDNGDVLDSSQGAEPLLYLQGHNNIIPGLEKEMEGKNVGDKFKVTIEAKDGYGEYDEGLVQKLPKEQFAQFPELTVGMRFHIDSNYGPMVVQVDEITDSEVTINGNHELAGTRLTFDVEVVEIRDASQEEIDHGHVHGPGGHQH